MTLYGQINHDSKAKENALKEFKTFGLDGYQNSYPDQLSGGMRQRAAFLRTALCKADILLLDEPFGALDVITRNDMQDWLLDIRRDLKRTILLVTHDLEEAIYLADRMLILYGRPSSIRKVIEIDAPPEARTREWLFEQAELKAELYHILENAETAWPGDNDDLL